MLDDISARGLAGQLFGLIALAAAWLDQGDINFMPSALALIAAGVLALSTRRPQSDNAAGIGA